LSFFFFFSSRRRHTRFSRDWSSDVCSSDLPLRSGLVPSTDDGRDRFLIPAGKARYLGEIVDNHERNREWVEQQVRLARERGRVRSEERRVGKECRARWAPDGEKKKIAQMAG